MLSGRIRIQLFRETDSDPDPTFPRDGFGSAILLVVIDRFNLVPAEHKNEDIGKCKKYHPFKIKKRDYCK